jgi:hypothetical protein
MLPGFGGPASTWIVMIFINIFNTRKEPGEEKRVKILSKDSGLFVLEMFIMSLTI